VHPFEIENSILLLVSFALLCVKGFALVDVVNRRPEVFPAADRQTKALWLILLSVALVAHLVFWNPIGILNLAGTVVALVYLLDVRPAVRALTRR
jgi:Protein of unknown function (DUF2516)